MTCPKCHHAAAIASYFKSRDTGETTKIYVCENCRNVMVAKVAPKLAVTKLPER